MSKQQNRLENHPWLLYTKPLINKTQILLNKNFNMAARNSKFLVALIDPIHANTAKGEIKQVGKCADLPFLPTESYKTRNLVPKIEKRKATDWPCGLHKKS